MANIGNESMESQVVSITIDRPEAGETLTVAVTPGLRVVLEFDPAAAKFAVEGDDFVLTLEDGAHVVLEGLVSAAQGGDAPTIQVAGIDIGADVLINQILALSGADEPIETAAGEDGEDGEDEGVDNGGGSEYVDSFGDLIAGLIKQGIIGETYLDFDLTSNGVTELLVEAEFISGGFLLSGGGFSSLAFGSPGVLSSVDFGPSGVGGSVPLPDVAPLASEAGDSDGGGGFLAPLVIDSINIITNEATGNLQIPDELILYLANANQGAGLSVSGPSYDGLTDNAYIWDAGDPALDSDDPANTWAKDGNGDIKFHIGGSGPYYEGSFTYEVTDGQGATGEATIHVENFATVKAGSYWTLTGTSADEVLLGQDGRNQIDGGGGDDIIHGGHDSGGDILMGGDGNDVIFGGTGNDDLQGGDGHDTFLMSAGFGRDDVDGGDGTDIISLDSVLTSADLSDPGDLSAWLTADLSYTHDTAGNTITFDGSASGTIDLGGGNEISFLNVEQIVYTDII